MNVLKSFKNQIKNSGNEQELQNNIQIIEPIIKVLKKICITEPKSRYFPALINLSTGSSKPIVKSNKIIPNPAKGVNNS